MLTKLDILKSRAKSAYMAYNAVIEGLDCGHELAQHISSTARKYAQQFDKAMAEIERIDPTAPKGNRLSMGA